MFVSPIFGKIQNQRIPLRLWLAVLFRARANFWTTESWILRSWPAPNVLLDTQEGLQAREWITEFRAPPAVQRCRWENRARLSMEEPLGWKVREPRISFLERTSEAISWNPYTTDGETEAQRGQVSHPQVPSWLNLLKGWKLDSPTCVSQREKLNLELISSVFMKKFWPS